MFSIKKLGLSAAFLLSMMACVNVMAVDADDFVEEASAKGLAEIESSKAALEKSNSAEVRKFAQTMISDHTKANQELTKIAKAKKLELSDDPELMNQAKAFILKQRDGESFDEAYANNQVMAHEQTIELFREATQLKDAELKAFAEKTLPKLEHHLQMAQALQQSMRSNNNDNMGDNRDTNMRGESQTGGSTMDQERRTTPTGR